MSEQNTSIMKDEFQNKILNLEKKYFDRIYEIINSDSFKNDLLAIEKEIKTNYGEYSEKYGSVNKVNIMTERLLCHHLYMELNECIKGIYPSPISSDFGVRTDDCILCVDAKTINIKTNRVDISSTQLEENQNSFDNKKFPGIEVHSNLKAVDYFHEKELPVLTYIVKIIYYDDKYRFSLNREQNTPTIVLACIPNGKLSPLFDYNIVLNFKTYNYYTEAEDSRYKPIYIPDLEEKERQEFIKQECEARNFMPYPMMANKVMFIDSNRKIWWETSTGNKKCLRAVKSGSNMRVKNEYLKKRYDSENNAWEGYKEIKINEE